MPEKFDAIIIGSGFGGSVTACRLAENNAKVLVLERGRRWDVEDYPREPGDAWIYDANKPEKQNGWIDMRLLDDMAIIQGAAVGGGSLIYANISVEAPKQIFDQGWPEEITYQELKPYYDQVAKAMNVQVIPEGQITRRTRMMKEGAEKLGYGDRFSKLPLAVSFDEDWSYDLEDPFNTKHSKTFTNEYGREQGTCVHLGDCDIGCGVKAKNTLELTYLAKAENEGAEVRPLHFVRTIEPEGNGYRVHWDRVANGKLLPGNAFAERVILAAGSLGSTEMLLRCRDDYETLPGISPRLGYNWSSNGDFLTPAFCDRDVFPTQGPTISSCIDFTEEPLDGSYFFIEDGGFPNVADNYLREKLEEGGGGKFKILIEGLRDVLRSNNAVANVMPWFAQGIDAADGRLYLGRKLTAPWKSVLKLDWEIDRSEEMVDAIVSMHKRLAGVTGGDPWVPPTWTVLKNLVTPHPLGGCNMGPTRTTGVVDHAGRVFGYDRLYVIDGAIIPEAIGRNPTRTIAALAERAAQLMASEGPADTSGSVRQEIPKEEPKGSIGVTFSETMAGGFALGKIDPRAGRKAGEGTGSELAIHAKVSIDDLDGFIEDPNHLGGLTGTIDFTAFGEGIVGTHGVFNLFNPTDEPELKLMVYELGFEHGGESYYFAGRKEVRDDFGFDLWSDTTTLYSKLHRGKDKSGPVVGAGVLSLGVRDLIALLKTVETPGATEGPDRLAAISRFGTFFLGELWDSYISHVRKD